MKKIILLLGILLIATACFGPKTDSDKIEAVLKKTKSYAKKKNWTALYALFSKDSTLKIDLLLRALFQAIGQKSKFAADELDKSHLREIAGAHATFASLSGRDYFVKAFEAIEKYPEYLKLFLGNLKINEAYEILEIRVLNEKGVVLIKTLLDQREALFFVLEGQEWKLLFIDETERFALK